MRTAVNNMGLPPGRESLTSYVRRCRRACVSCVHIDTPRVGFMNFPDGIRRVQRRSAMPSAFRVYGSSRSGCPIRDRIQEIRPAWLRLLRIHAPTGSPRPTPLTRTDRYLKVRAAGKNSRSNTHAMKMTRNRQVTIPQRLRLKFGPLPDTEVVFEEAAGCVATRPKMSEWARIEERIRRVRGVADGGLSTDEVMRLTRREDWSPSGRAVQPQSPGRSSRRNPATRRRLARNIAGY